MVSSYTTKGKAQQSGTWARDPEGTAKEGDSQRKVQRTFKMLKEVWLNIGIKKTDVRGYPYFHP